MENKVIGGKYIKCKVSCDGDRKILFIQDGRERIPITNKTIAKYELINAKPGTLFSNRSKTYAIIWNDGSKSVINILDMWSDIFISGCETGGIDVSEEEMARRRRIGYGTIIFLGILFVLFVIYVALRTDDKTNQQNNTSTTVNVLASTGRKKWVKWNMEDLTELPDAETYISVLEDQVGEPDASAEDVYHIKGTLVNNHGAPLWDIKLRFGLYVDGTKVDNCSGTITGKTERASVVPYDVVCLSWPEGAQYKILDVSAQ